MSQFRVLVCGGRDYADREAVWRELDAIRSQNGDLCVIEGGAGGADGLARDWARTHNGATKTFRATWSLHGKAAGPIRNQRMIDEGKPHLCLAFPGGKGTADMVRRARAARVPVLEITP